MNFERDQDADAASAVADTRRIETLRRADANEAAARNTIDALKRQFDSLMTTFSEGRDVDPLALDMLGSQIAGAVSAAQDCRAGGAARNAA